MGPRPSLLRTGGSNTPDLVECQAAAADHVFVVELQNALASQVCLIRAVTGIEEEHGPLAGFENGQAGHTQREPVQGSPVQVH